MHDRTKEVAERKLPPLDTYLYKILSWKPRVRVGLLGGTRVRLKCELVAPEKQAGRSASVDLQFVEYAGSGEKVGCCEFSGTTVLLVAPSSLAASVLEVLCAGRFRYLKIDYRPVLRHRLEDVESFELIGELDEDDLD